MLIITVNEPHEEEAAAHTVIDPEIGHEDTYFDNGIVKNFSPQKKPRKDA